MPTSPALLVLRGLRADAAGLAAAVTVIEPPAGRGLLCAAAAELAELAGAHAQSARENVLGTLGPDARIRAGAQLHDLQRAADAVGDAAAVLGAAGLSGRDRDEARSGLAGRLAALAAVLPAAAERTAAGWDTAAVRCPAPPWLVLGSALRDRAPDAAPDAAPDVLPDAVRDALLDAVPEEWRLPWQQVRLLLHRSALHRVLMTAQAGSRPGKGAAACRG